LFFYLRLVIRVPWDANVQRFPGLAQRTQRTQRKRRSFSSSLSERRGRCARLFI